MRTKPLQQKIIGVLGGCSNVATAEYYRLLNEFVNTRLGGWEIAETLIVGMNFGNIEAWIRTGDDAAMEAYFTAKWISLKLPMLMLCYVYPTPCIRR